jgi:hypothetical protein
MVLRRKDRMTLEAIGKTYDITRERVRQIENFALASIKKSKEYKEHAFVFDELRAIVKELGAVVSEDHLMRHISKDPVVQNHINLYLALGDEFKKHKEDDHFHAHFTIDEKHAAQVREALQKALRINRRGRSCKRRRSIQSLHDSSFIHCR